MPKQSHKHRARLKLESLGFLVGDVEKFIPHTNVRIDLFGIIDLVALRGKETFALQVTDHTSVAKHVDKMLDEPKLQACLSAGWIVECWGIRSKPARDGSFAVVRGFQFTHGGRRVAAYDGSVVLE